MSDATPPPSWPPVSVVMPVLDEARHLGEAVAHVLGQDYPGPLEVVLALGPSSDGTDAVAADLAAVDARIRLVSNPTGRTPSGLNAAITAASSEIIVRVDGHSVLPADYIRIAVAALQETGADNVGGVMAAEGTNSFECAVAAAMTSPFGVGSAKYHTGGGAGPAASVYLGVFRRDILRRTGGYDEAFLRAQDWELNHRIAQAGGLVWFTPDLRVAYRPRRSYRALARQYFDYGRWRRVVMRRHSGTVNPRYLAPPVALVGSVVGLAVGTFLWRPALALPAGYAALLSAGAVLTARGDSALSVAGAARLPLVFATMHLSWGAGFLTSPPTLGEPDQPASADIVPN